MKKNSGMKKVTIGVTAAALAAAMSMSVFAAAPGMGGMNGMAQQGMEMQTGGRGGFGGGFENRMDGVKEKIDALTDSSVKSNLNALMEKLETAMEAERKLMEANRPEKPADEAAAQTEASSAAAADSTEKKQPPRFENGRNGQRPEKPADNGTRPELPQNAAGGQRPERPERKADGAESTQNADQARPEESTEMKAAREAVEEARTALENALKEAGIEEAFGFGGKDGFQNGGRLRGPKFAGGQAGAGTSAATASETT